MSEIDTRVAALRFELAQVEDHPGDGFRARAKEIRAELEEWLHPDHPAEPAPSEVVSEPPAEEPEAPAEEADPEPPAKS